MSRFPLLATLLLAGASASAQNVATVNGEPLPKVTLDLWVQLSGQPDTPALRTKIVQNMVDRAVLLQEAKRRGVPERPQSRFKADFARDTALIQDLLQEAAAATPVGDADVKAEYERLVRENEANKEYLAHHILVDTEAQAKAIIAKLHKGGKFEELAKQSKDGGSSERGGQLDWAAASTYAKPFGDALAALEKGKITETPVQTQYGWHVIRLDDVRVAAIADLDKSASDIREHLQQQRALEVIEALKKKATVVYN